MALCKSASSGQFRGRAEEINSDPGAQQCLKDHYTELQNDDCKSEARCFP